MIYQILKYDIGKGLQYFFSKRTNSTKKITEIKIFMFKILKESTTGYISVILVKISSHLYLLIVNIN